MSQTSTGAQFEATEWNARLEAQIERTENLLDLLMREEDYEVSAAELEIPEGFRLSIVMPVYNEEATIETILSRVAALPIPKEVIVVDDCSRDGTRDRIAPLLKARELRLITKDKNEGKGAALRTGFAAASGDVIVIQDADLEYDPRDIVDLLRPILAGEADVVYGSRFLGPVPQDPSRLHRIGNRALTAASNLFTGLRLTDMETCYKALRRDVLMRLELRQDRFGFEPEITAKLARLGVRIQEVPVRYNARSYREGKKIGLRDAWNALACIARYGLGAK